MLSRIADKAVIEKLYVDFHEDPEYVRNCEPHGFSMSVDFGEKSQTDTEHLAWKDSRGNILVYANINFDWKSRMAFVGPIVTLKGKRNKGHGYRCYLNVLDYMFSSGMEYIAAYVFELNAPSRKLHRKLGFSEEGFLRKWIFYDGKDSGCFIFGMLAEEYHPPEGFIPERKL